MSWIAVLWACSAVVVSHCTYGKVCCIKACDD
ncbi:Uncharacterised protein [Mycobacterium tuberculosis]|nr:Uncharacterised protein [Mycobacterium tuberculosis]COW58776.1 Uncharacterised protein [Mycobacterium tuberculosis]CPB17723.1 Uncharacterised protein [Mycobacterium tuberculosis]